LQKLILANATFSGFLRIARLISFACFYGGNMAQRSSTFSESWHRISDLKVSLRSTVKVRRQIFRGIKWYVLYDPFNNTFFRLRPEAYDFISRLRPDRTVESIWEESLRRNPGSSPGQEDVLQLLTQLYYSNLLYFKMPADSTKLFERYRKRRQREIRSKLLSIMFMRFPLFDPDRFLQGIIPLIRPLFGILGAFCWVTVMAIAAKLVFERFDQVTEQVQGILAPDNLLLLYAGMVVVKTLHEFGHAMACKRYGGEVHTMGVMLLIFTPLPYLDATSSWSFRSRWQRALVGAAGMITELFLAGLATIAWAYTGAGTIHSLAYNVMFIASVSTIIFNGNPLLRFDGYYILSDLLDIPNLSTRAMQHLRHLAERYLFGYRDSISPSQSGKEAFWLTVFGILSGIYRVIVFTGIILFVADKFLLAGLLMALLCIVSWGIVPIFRLLKYLATSPRLAKTRARAIMVCLVIMLSITFALGMLPFPNRFRSPGLLEAVRYIRVVNHAPGLVSTLLVESGTWVETGTPLVKLENRELEIETKRTEAQKKEALALQMRAMSKAVEDLKPIQKRLESIEEKLKNLYQHKKDLIVRARQDGLWVVPVAEELEGKWVPKGSLLGEIIDNHAFRFSSVVSQDDAANLFVDQIQKAEVRLYGQENKNLAVSHFKIIPFQHDQLPSAALGWMGGGEVAVSLTDDTGIQASEPFFLIFAEIEPSQETLFLHGRSGKIRFSLAKEPLAVQWGRGFRQLLQKRYQI
jgi:putative peptide zinc metalloprotease protein